MAKSPAFQFYPADWLSSPKVMMMTPAQEGAYIRLICISWQNGDGSLPNDDAQLARLSRLGKNWQRCAELIKSCFELRNERLYHPRVLSELEKQESFRGAQRDRVNKRWNAQKVDNQQQKNTVVQNGIYQPDTELYSLSISSTSIKEKDKKENADAPAQTESLKRFIPPTETDLQTYFDEKRPDWPIAKRQLEVQKFLSHYGANGWRVGKNPMKDWKQSASGWMLRAGDYGQVNGTAQAQAQVNTSRPKTTHEIIAERQKANGTHLPNTNT